MWSGGGRGSIANIAKIVDVLYVRPFTLDMVSPYFVILGHHTS